jgi:hypothetical protein
VIALDCARAEPASIPPTLEEGSVRRRPALLSALTAAALVTVALAGCAAPARGAGNQPGGCTPALPTGDASSIVKAPGTVGKAPKATFPTPLVSSGDQVTVLKAGHGAPAQKGAQVKTEVTVFDGKTGESLASTSYDNSSPLPAVAGVSVPGQSAPIKSSLDKALICAQTGSRIALTTTGKSFGLVSASAGQSLVAVIDVSAVYLGKADGVNQLPKDGMPNVITAVDGQPGIVLQELDKPTSARSEVVKAGGGAVLKKGDAAVSLFTTWVWPSSAGGKPTVVDAAQLNTWSSRTSSALPTAASGGLPTALRAALVGQRVGSQILVVLPPKDGFGAQAASQLGVGTKDTLIMVIDILGIAK